MASNDPIDVLSATVEERLGLAGRDIDEEPTDEDKLNAFCRMIDAAMAKAVSDA